MQISQTRAKFQIQGLGNGLPGLLCILLAQAEIVGAVAPFARRCFYREKMDILQASEAYWAH